MAHAFLLHVDDQCPAVQRPNTEEIHVLVPAELLWGLGRMRT